MAFRQANIDEIQGGASVAAASPTKMRVLLIEDDVETANEIVSDLSERGYDVAHVADGIDGLAKARMKEFMLVIVDRMLPGLDGLSILETLRREDCQVPVLVSQSIDPEQL